MTPINEIFCKELPLRNELLQFLGFFWVDFGKLTKTWMKKAVLQARKSHGVVFMPLEIVIRQVTIYAGLPLNGLQCLQFCLGMNSI